ncbi:MAG TPA: hypothetical protein DE045_10140 [Oceanospirillaceae bacterium]|nr:hypothetical protein [Oceanospirillaceae bacterium]
MIKEPQVGYFIDDEERALVEALELGPEAGPSFLNATRLQELKNAARATINEQRTRISLRVPNSDLSRLKAKALKEGLPYQTLINSILHKASL